VLLSLLSIMLPLLVLVCGGYFFARLAHFSGETLVRTVMDFFLPMLVFHSLYGMDTEPGEIGKVALASALVLAALLAVSLVYARLAGADARSFVPPVIFMNSGFLGIPVMKLWGGLAAVNLVVVYDQVQTLFIFTVGILIVAGGFSASGVKQVLRAPVLWAILAGFLFHFLRIPLPGLVLKTLEFGGAGSPALAAFALGCTLHKTELSLNVHLIAGVLMRSALGFLAGLGAARLLRLESTAASVVIVASSLPSAVLSSVLPARYRVKPNLAGPIVLATTVLGILTIPAALYLAAKLSR
jgi:predicted permease